MAVRTTHFNNPNGLPDETHYTTAGDMMKIAKAAWYNPRFRKFVTTQVYEIPPTNKQSETRYLLNHHKMMPGQSYAYDGVLGGKTGYTDAAGSTLVTYAKRGNSILIAVVLNSTNGAFPDTTSLLDYGFDNFEKVDLNIDTDPVPAVFLPCEKHLLKDWNNLCSFYYMRHVYVTVPTGTDVSQLVKKQKLLNNSVGPKRIKSKYYLDGHMVGYGMQYERKSFQISFSTLLFSFRLRRRTSFLSRSSSASSVSVKRNVFTAKYFSSSVFRMRILPLISPCSSQLDML